MGLGIGCGSDDGLGRRYRVTGKVTYNGQPVEKGNISFMPVGGAESARGAGGEITDGYYSLSTLGDNDGAFPGKYKVAVVAMDVDLSPYMKHGGVPDQVNVSKAESKAKRLVPAKYQLPDKSGLTAEVGEKDEEINFDLTD